MNLILNYPIPLIFIIGTSLFATYWYLTKNGAVLIYGTLLSIFLSGFTGTYLKHKENQENAMYVIIDYSFVLLCFFLFVYFIGESTKEVE